jgi:anti-sigma factor (TIGR02949 family)
MTSDHEKGNTREIDCIEAIDMLYAYLDGEIEDAVAIEELEQHIEHCHSCFTRSQLEKELTKRMKNSASKRAPESLKDRLHKLMDSF